MKTKKIIYFYTYEPNERNILNGYWDTKDAIRKGEVFIKTTQMALLSSELLELDYDIYIFEPNEEAFTITYNKEKNEIFCDKTNRCLRLVHNLEKMWKAGEFCN